MATPSLTQSLAAIVQAQIAQLHNNPNLPKTDYSNLSQDVIDPNSYATNAANAQYNPAIAALAHQIAGAQPQSDLNQSNITDWFKQATDTYNAGAANSAQQYDNASSQLQGSAAAFMAALGGGANSANPGIAQQALVQQGGLAANRMADVNMDTNMHGLIPLGAAQAHVNETGRVGKQLSDLNSALAAQKSAKGAFFQQALSDATGKRFDQLSSIDQAKADAGQRMFDNRMARKSANTSTMGQVANSIMAQMQLGPQAAQAKANLAQTQARTRDITALTAARKAAGSANTGAINLNNAKDVSVVDKMIRGDITTSFTNANGKPVTQLNGNPRQAWSKIVGFLARYNINNPHGIAIAKSIFKDYLTGKNAGWYFDKNGKLRNDLGVQAVLPPSPTAAHTPPKSTKPIAAAPYKPIHGDKTHHQ